MSELDPLRLDRELARLARRWVSWRRRLRDGEGLAEDPFDETWACSKAGLDAVEAWPPYDPLREPARRWVYRLLEQRINRPLVARLSAAWRVQTYPFERPLEGERSLSQTVTELLATPSRAPTCLDQLRRHSEPISSLGRLLWARRQELSERLGFEHPEQLSGCRDDSVGLARQWLVSTSELAEPSRAGAEAYLRMALGLDASQGWPARMHLRTFNDWLGQGSLLRGLHFVPHHLAEPLAPASFFRALAAIGAAWSDAHTPVDQPFVIATDPWGLRRAIHGSLFALIPLEGAFQKRCLGWGSVDTRHARRVLAGVVLLESRAAALRVVLRQSAFQGGDGLRQEHEALAEEQVGAWFAELAPLCLLRPRQTSPQRFLGWMRAAGEHQRLREAHDEDWWRNPRACEELRANASLPPLQPRADERDDPTVVLHAWLSELMR